MTLEPNQKAELDHLVRICSTHPNWAEYARWKAKYRAAKEPQYWGWLPEALAKATATSGAETT
ncbi:hypothetical protein [Variovorax sp. GT1P44]|uniref:hypothetical protein n=1 Tax=Variovorax sp. GT1P44 TaxID=3443742 RepID=UPI003F464459